MSKWHPGLEVAAGTSNLRYQTEPAATAQLGEEGHRAAAILSLGVQGRLRVNSVRLRLNSQIPAAAQGRPSVL